MPGETNTDDLSPAPDAWSRPDIPLHALAMLKNAREGITPDKEGHVGPLSTYKKLQEKGFPLAYVGDVVGTGSSRKSATNSILWFFGHDIPNVPNKRGGGVCIGNKIAPIFYNTMEDSGTCYFRIFRSGGCCFPYFHPLFALSCLFRCCMAGEFGRLIFWRSAKVSRFPSARVPRPAPICPNTNPNPNRPFLPTYPSLHHTRRAAAGDGRGQDEHR